MVDDALPVYASERHRFAKILATACQVAIRDVAEHDHEVTALPADAGHEFEAAGQRIRLHTRGSQLLGDEPVAVAADDPPTAACKEYVAVEALVVRVTCANPADGMVATGSTCTWPPAGRSPNTPANTARMKRFDDVALAPAVTSKPCVCATEAASIKDATTNHRACQHTFASMLARWMQCTSAAFSPAA